MYTAVSVPDASPDGRYALYREDDRQRHQSIIHVVQIDNGAPVPFQIVVPYQLQQATENLLWGRARWMPGSKAIVFVGPDALGRPTLFQQDFAPGQNTSGTRHPILSSLPQAATESFSISPDGRWLAVADATYEQSVMLARNLPGVLSWRRR